MLTNLSVVFEIRLVCDDDNRELVLILDTEDLLVECGDFLERASRRDGVYEEEAFTGAHVLFPHSTVVLSVRRVAQITRPKKNAPVFLLTSGIEHV